jgi:hypothetical protein
MLCSLDVETGVQPGGHDSAPVLWSFNCSNT